jgi:hypothetical protein
MLVVLLGSLGMLVGSCCWDAGDLVGSLIPLLLGALAWRNSRTYGQAGWSVELLHWCAECS